METCNAAFKFRVICEVNDFATDKKILEKTRRWSGLQKGCVLSKNIKRRVHLVSGAGRVVVENTLVLNGTN
jgi:hypothetical protein